MLRTGMIAGVLLATALPWATGQTAPSKTDAPLTLEDAIRLAQANEPAFAAAVTELLQNDGLRRQMGDRGTQVVRNLWTLEQAGERLARHLERAAGAGQSAARMTVARTAT